MKRYPVRCRNNKCRHRRLTSVHPDDYKVVPACLVCGERKGWRIEHQAVDKRELCECGGVVHLSTAHNARAVRHKIDHPMCLKNPEGARNHLLRAGCKESELFDLLPLDALGRKMSENEPCPF